MDATNAAKKKVIEEPPPIHKWKCPSCKGNMPSDSEELKLCPSACKEAYGWHHMVCTTCLRKQLDVLLRGSAGTDIECTSIVLYLLKQLSAHFSLYFCCIADITDAYLISLQLCCFPAATLAVARDGRAILSGVPSAITCVFVRKSIPFTSSVCCRACKSLSQAPFSMERSAT